jgi:Rrf2 family protein
MISNKCVYALKAILELAKREGSGPVTIAEIAARQQIPVRFLEAILRQLKQGGFTDSLRGKDGGYVLARSAAAIRMGDVMRIFESPLSSGGSPGSRDGEATVFCTIWEEAQRALNGVYDGINFRELVERDRELHQKRIHDYSI